jgi:hypothetical protein
MLKDFFHQRRHHHGAAAGTDRRRRVPAACTPSGGAWWVVPFMHSRVRRLLSLSLRRKPPPPGWVSLITYYRKLSPEQTAGSFIHIVLLSWRRPLFFPSTKIIIIIGGFSAAKLKMTHSFRPAGAQPRRARRRFSQRLFCPFFQNSKRRRDFWGIG